MFWLEEPFKTLWQGQDPFVAVEALQGQVYRELDGRRTLRTEVNGKGYFVKIHRGVGWGEIVKTLFQFKRPVLGSGQEMAAIRRLHEVGVPTMTAVAFGQQGGNPARCHSFIITEELAPTVDLEIFSENWRTEPPEPLLKWALIRRVAEMTGAMHRSGVNHQDCYICHFLLDTGGIVSANDLNVFVIDLHRAQIRDDIPFRWRSKDLAALYFSAMDIGLTRRDLLRFLRLYFRRSLRELLGKEKLLLRTIQVKADKLYRRKQRYGGRL